MAATQSAEPDTTERPACGRCEGSGARRIWHAGAWRRVQGLCPECGGSGLGSRASGPSLSNDEAHAVLRDLRDLGMDLAEWRYAKTPDAKDRRAETRRKIRQVVSRGINTFTFDDMRKELGISRQQLNSIRNENPTGRPGGHVAETVLLERQRNQRLIQLGGSYALWGHTDTAERDNVCKAIREAAQQAFEDGLTRKEVAELLGTSVETLRTILREDPTRRNRG